MNILAKLRCVPSVNAPLTSSIDAILGVQLERVYVRLSRDISGQGGPLTNEAAFKLEGTPSAPIHQLLVQWMKTRVPPSDLPTFTPPMTVPLAKVSLTSFRQFETFNSMQVVVEKFDTTGLVAGAKAPSCYADLDIDLGAR